ncbi:MAG: radical SAM family heme chaperone HemW [Lachnospiraceae bacterium]|jgi:oxygen-independent coproporphyrinogen-3 oxidase|nr:radical SAM family heme chaperone HemW [Lachnospiraceae bacterium]MEE3460703.1 radical SAM family heme chaperone HemW [Lachnospiraceae bacterium]
MLFKQGGEIINNRKPLALYIHIPFCVRKCLYCDFRSWGGSSRDSMDEYTDVLTKEIRSWGKELHNRYFLDTVFIGGGTPSILPAEDLVKIDEAVFCAFPDACDTVREYSIEANPGTVDEKKAEYISRTHVDRVSIGLQTMNEDELKILGRIHSSDDFLRTYDFFRKCGIENINVDIMADIPDQTVDSYRHTLEKVISLKPEHISSYSLIVEEGTPFYQMHQKGELHIPDEDTDRLMYHMTKEMLAEAGFHRYEISNYALNGCECIHNKHYWQTDDYLGVGLNASSCLLNMRFRNADNFDDYYRSVGLEGRLVSEALFLLNADHPAEDDKAKNNISNNILLKENIMSKENLLTDEKILSKEKISSETGFRCEVTHRTLNDCMEEFMFMGLRMTDGVSGREFRKRFLRTVDYVYGNVISDLTSKRLLEYDRDRDIYRLTDRGLDISNYCMSEFILD